tara:strand:+ start:891 stop:2225 length:1335 start_codon:yes stop_codon:yes gene_type:complete
MGGGLMQMIKSNKSNYIVGNPQMTFFKSVYKRHTNFSMETIEVMMNSYPTINETITTAIIPKNAGDLLENLYYDVKLTGNAHSGAGGGYLNWINGTGYAYIKEVSLLIGNQEIEKHYSEWFDIWNELTDIDLKEHLLVNKWNDKDTYYNNNQLANGETQNPVQLYIPMKFFFCRNAGLSIPLLALQYDDIKIKTMFRKVDYIINAEYTASTATQIPEVKLYANYIYLDTTERRIFTQKPHEYLIEQIQHNGKVTLDANNGIHELNFNNLVKEIIWIVKQKAVEETDPTVSGATAVLSNLEGSSVTKGNDYFNYTSPFGPLYNVSHNDDVKNLEYLGNQESPEPFNTAVINIDGNERFVKQKASYFRSLQPFYHHSKVPQKHIYSYSFALYPEKHQPSGFCDFTKFKNININFTIPIPTANLLVFAIGYNVLRVSEGKAGLAYLV